MLNSTTWDAIHVEEANRDAYDRPGPGSIAGHDVINIWALQVRLSS